jgi:hypothetical protein
MAQNLFQYPVDKRKVFVGFVRGDWTEEVVRQLKMAMEEWVQKVPPHRTSFTFYIILDF